MLSVKRDPQAVAAALNSVLVVLGVVLNWEPELTGSLVAVVTAAAFVIQRANVIGTDEFTTALVGLASTLFPLGIAFGMHSLTDEVQSAVLGAIPILLGLLARNGVTNQHTPAGIGLARDSLA